MTGHATLCLVQQPDDILGEGWRLRSDGIHEVIPQDEIGAMLLVEPTARWRQRRMRFNPNAVVHHEIGDPLERSLIFCARLSIKLSEVRNKKVVGL
jgi:hypothetical protein